MFVWYVPTPVIALIEYGSIIIILGIGSHLSNKQWNKYRLHEAYLSLKLLWMPLILTSKTEVVLDELIGRILVWQINPFTYKILIKSPSRVLRITSQKMV